MRGEVAASVAASQTIVQQAQQGTGASASAQAVLQQASANSYQAVSDFERDYYGRRIFDRYLSFKSPEDEEAYRRREAERQEAIDRARAEGTPEGNLRANELAIAQLQDAGAHGADRSPDFRPTMDRLQRSHTALKQAIEHKTPQTPAQQASAPMTENSDPLQSVGAKAPTAKGAAAVLLAAGISQPQADNVGHGVNDRTGQPNSLVRGG